MVRRQILQSHPSVSVDRRENVVEIVGDAASKGTQGFQFLGTHLRGLRALEVGEIAIDFQNARGFAVRIVVKNPLAGDKNGAVVASAMTKFAFPCTIAVQSLHDVSQGGRKLSLKQFVRIPAERLSARKAIELLSAASPKDDAVVHITNDNGSEIEEGGLLAEFFIDAPAIGDVTENHGVEFLAIDLGLRDGGIDGKFLTVATHAEDGIHTAHPATRGVGFAEVADVLGVVCPKAKRNKAVERRTESNGGLATEHGFGGGIKHSDALVGRNSDDAIHGGADDGGQASFMFGYGVLNAAALGDVAGNLGSTDDDAGRIAEGRDGDRDKNASAVFADASGFEVTTNGLASGNTAKNVGLFDDAAGRQEHMHGLTHRFGGGIAENALGTGIPTGDDTVESLADDSVVGRFDDGCEVRIATIRGLDGVNQLAVRNIELLDGSIERESRPKEQEGEHGDAGGGKDSEAESSSVETGMLKKEAKEGDGGRQNDRGGQQTTRHATGDARGVEGGSQSEIGASGPDAETEDEEQGRGVDGHGVSVEGAVEIREVEEVCEQMEEGDVGDAEGEKLCEARAPMRLDAKAKQGRSKQCERNAGSDGEAAGRYDAGGLKGRSEKNVFEPKIDAECEFEECEDGDEGNEEREYLGDACSSDVA